MPPRISSRRDRSRDVISDPLTGFIPGNQITLLQNGSAYFPALETACDQAVHEIYLETYIYQDDAAGRRIAEALKRAVLRGVKVYLLIDGYGSKGLPRKMMDHLQSVGIKTLVFRPRISPWTFQRSRLRRMHRKIAVVDREIAFVGGINIVDDGESPGDRPPRYDYAVAVTGPLVDAILLAARRLWAKTAWRNFKQGAGRAEALPEPDTTGGQMRATFRIRDNIRHRRDIEAAYLLAIDQAKSEIIIANAYFLPGYNFRHALIEAAGRGVRVVLLLQGKSDHLLQHYATRALYGHFLAAGIEIYEFHASFLHAKVAVIDGHWATVGSSNIDPFSLLLSYEANVVVDDEDFAAKLSQSLTKTLAADGQRILRGHWEQQPALTRFIGWLSYGLLRLMLGISGYARDNYRATNGPKTEPGN